MSASEAVSNTSIHRSIGLLSWIRAGNDVVILDFWTAYIDNEPTSREERWWWQSCEFMTFWVLRFEESLLEFCETLGRNCGVVCAPVHSINFSHVRVSRSLWAYIKWHISPLAFLFVRSCVSFVHRCLSPDFLSHRQLPEFSRSSKVLSARIDKLPSGGECGFCYAAHWPSSSRCSASRSTSAAGPSRRWPASVSSFSQCH